MYEMKDIREQGSAFGFSASQPSKRSAVNLMAQWHLGSIVARRDDIQLSWPANTGALDLEFHVASRRLDGQHRRAQGELDQGMQRGTGAFANPVNPLTTRQLTDDS